MLIHPPRQEVARRALLARMNVTCGDVLLRPPTQKELLGCAERIALEGIVGPEDPPFSRWYLPESKVKSAQAFYEAFRRPTLAPRLGTWELHFGVFVRGEMVGMQSLGGRDFERTATCRSSSWLFADVRGRGYGTASRFAVAHVAFVELGAKTIVSHSAPGNEASLRVSKKLGYEETGFENFSYQGRELALIRLELDARRYEDSSRPVVHAAGFACWQ